MQSHKILRNRISVEKPEAKGDSFWERRALFFLRTSHVSFVMRLSHIFVHFNSYIPYSLFYFLSIPCLFNFLCLLRQVVFPSSSFNVKAILIFIVWPLDVNASSCRHPVSVINGRGGNGEYCGIFCYNLLNIFWGDFNIILGRGGERGSSLSVSKHCLVCPILQIMLQEVWKPNEAH